MSSALPFDAEARRETAEWLKSWARVGPVLEARRALELSQLTEIESGRIAVELLWPMVPPGPGDNGEGLRVFQDLMRRLARRA